MTAKLSEFAKSVRRTRGKASLLDFGQAVGIHPKRVEELEAGKGEEPAAAEIRRIKEARDKFKTRK